MQSANERSAREGAEQVIRDYSITSWPLIPEQIAQAVELPIEVKAGFPANTYGALFKRGNAFSIIISADCHTTGQRRFTLCHELGHYFLDGHVDALFESGTQVHLSNASHFRSKKLWYEVEADVFAAELLVPTRRAREVISKVGPGLRAVRSIEAAFDTSLVCAGVRYANLTTAHVVVILSHGKTIEWASCSSSVQEHVWARWRKKGDWAPPRSATFTLAHSPARVLASDECDGEGNLAEWFDGAPDVRVTEEVVGLGAYGRLLTILTCDELRSADSYRIAQERTDTRSKDWRDPLRTWEWDRYDEVDDP